MRQENRSTSWLRNTGKDERDPGTVFDLVGRAQSSVWDVSSHGPKSQELKAFEPATSIYRPRQLNERINKGKSNRGTINTMASDSNTPLASASFYCALCNNVAGTLDLLPPGHPDGLSKDVATLFLRDFIGTDKEIVSADSREALRTALTEADAAALYAVERLWAPFYCPECACVYCRRHWVVIPNSMKSSKTSSIAPTEPAPKATGA